MATKTEEGIMLDGEELVAIVKEMGLDITSISYEVVGQDDEYFYRPWIEELGAHTYALTIEHDYDEEHPLFDPDEWQEVVAAYVEANHPEVEIDDDGWLPNVVFHV